MDNPTINILFNFVEGPWGGANQFLKALREKWREIGVYEEEPFNADIVLYNSYPFRYEESFNTLYKAKRRNNNLLIIHRIDGPISYARNTDFLVDKIIYYFNEKTADGTIFQSNWSKNANMKSGLKTNKFETVIFNAPNPEIFYRRQKPCDNDKIKIITNSWSSNKNKGFDIIEFLNDNLDFDKYHLTVIGNMPKHYENLSYTPPMASKELANVMRKHDIFLFPSIIESCSNSLIEAIHCGLPVLARNSTSNPEIVKNAGVLFNGKEDVIEKLGLLVQNINSYNTKLELPDIEKIADLYYNFAAEIHNSTINFIYSPKVFSVFALFKIKSLTMYWKAKKYFEHFFQRLKTK